jgi:hypothetical protein
MKKMRTLPCTLMVLFITCSTLFAADVTVDWDKQADFTHFKTYAWGRGTPAKNPLMDQRIVAAIDKQLASKGLQKVDDPSNADLVVIYHAAVGEQTQLNTTDMGGGWGWRWGSGMSTTTVDKIPTGQLVVDIGDARTKKLLWLGNAKDTLSDKPEKNEEKINKAVEKMFAKFPPPVKK